MDDPQASRFPYQRKACPSRIFLQPAGRDGILIGLPASQEQQAEFVVRFVYDVASTR